MMEGVLATPKTSAPRRKTLVATYWFAPLIRMTAATPMTTPTRVRTLRSLCAQRLLVAIATASLKFIVVARAMGVLPKYTCGEWVKYRVEGASPSKAKLSAALGADGTGAVEHKKQA